jgi:cell wall-associated NlpC family hydrolase
VGLTSWNPVTYGDQAGYVSSDYLDILTIGKARRALLKYLRVPYIWGGQSASGLDCSGLVGEWWEDIGFRPEGFDTTADKLYDAYREGKLPAAKLDRCEFGALVFYGSGTNAKHIVIGYDEETAIGADHGTDTTKTKSAAYARGAMVQLETVDYRPDRLGIYLPAYGWWR